MIQRVAAASLFANFSAKVIHKACILTTLHTICANPDRCFYFHSSSSINLQKQQFFYPGSIPMPENKNQPVPAPRYIKLHNLPIVIRLARGTMISRMLRHQSWQKSHEELEGKDPGFNHPKLLSIPMIKARPITQ